jgi:hypothetical protein
MIVFLFLKNSRFQEPLVFIFKGWGLVFMKVISVLNVVVVFWYLPLVGGGGGVHLFA